MTAQDQQSRAELSDFEAWYAKQCMRSDDAKQGLIRAWAHLAWKAARALPAGDDALLPIAAKSHGAWDGLEELLAVPDGTDIYTAAQVQAMGRVPPGWQAVPVEPTDGMLGAGWRHVEGMASMPSVWRAMLAAAPRPPAAQERKPLTPEQIHKWWASENGLEDCDMGKLIDFTAVVREVEAKLGVKPSP